MSLERLRIVGECLIPSEVWEQFAPTNNDLITFLEVLNPDQWPLKMRGLWAWMQENLPAHELGWNTLEEVAQQIEREIQAIVAKSPSKISRPDWHRK